MIDNHIDHRQTHNGRRLGLDQFWTFPGLTVRCGYMPEAHFVSENLNKCVYVRLNLMVVAVCVRQCVQIIYKLRNRDHRVDTSGPLCVFDFSMLPW